MSWTGQFGRGSGWLLQKIVNGLAISKISPNALTFIGLLINIVAALFFGWATRWLLGTVSVRPSAKSA